MSFVHDRRSFNLRITMSIDDENQRVKHAVLFLVMLKVKMSLVLSFCLLQLGNNTNERSSLYFKGKINCLKMMIVL